MGLKQVMAPEGNYCKCSIIIPLFNRELLVEQTIASLIRQTASLFEVIIVDDGSTDNSLEVCKGLALNDNRIKVLRRTREPKGASVCRNIGLQNASGDYVIFLDSDDLLLPHCLETRLRYFEQNPSYDFLVFNGALFNDDPTKWTNYWNVQTNENILQRFLKLDAPWQTSGPIYKRSFLQTINGFDEALPFWQDYDLHLKALLHHAKYKVFFDEVDYLIRDGRSDTISRSSSFVGKLSALEFRYNYFSSVVEKVLASNLAVEKQTLQAAKSTQFYFLAQYVLRHRALGLFKKYFAHYSKTWEVRSRERLQSLYLIALLKGAQKIKSLKSRAEKVIRTSNGLLPDYFILTKTKLQKVPVD